MIKRYILEHQDTIRNAFFRTSEYKEELLTCQKILSQKCGIDFNSERIKVDITSLIFYLKHDHLYKKYSSQGYNSDEIN